MQQKAFSSGKQYQMSAEMSESKEKGNSKHGRSLGFLISLLISALASFIVEILMVAGVVLVSLLALYFRVIEDILIIILAAFCLVLIALWRSERKKNPLRRTFPDEVTAIEGKGGIREWLEGLPEHSEIRVIGVTGTSIFWLFDVYVKLMSKGCKLEILSLDRKAEDLVDLLAENEPEKDSRELVDKLLDRLQEMQKCQTYPDIAVIQEAKQLLEGAKQTKSKREIRLFVFESCARLWLHARDKAIQLKSMKHNPLKLKYYTQIPYLKVWTTFPPTLCFSGSYITQPNTGMSNPIVVLDPKKSAHDRIVVNKIIEAMKLLLEHESTRIINTLSDISDRKDTSQNAL